MLSSRGLNKMKDCESNYPQELRKHFTKLDKVLCNNHYPCRYLSDEQGAQFEDHSLKAALYEKQKGYAAKAEIAEKLRKYQVDQGKSSGGDADRSMYSYYSGDSDRQNNGPPPASRHVHSTSKMKIAPKPSSGKEKYQQSFIPKEPNLQDCIGDPRFMSDNLSNMGDFCNPSEDGSCKSQKSTRTVVSRRSSQELRNLVKSKCKLHEEVENAIEQLLNPEDADKCQKDFHMSHEKNAIQLDTLPTSHCQHCTDKIHPLQLSRRDVTTEIGKLDFAEGQNLDTLTISVDDVVNSKVINPMIRKLQRMYLNNLKEEMSLMEDLERLPHKVNEVYKATIFKKRE